MKLIIVCLAVKLFKRPKQLSMKKYNILIMSVSKRFSIVIMDHEKIHDINNLIVKYSDTLSQGSSHLIFDVEPVNNGDVANDLTFSL